MPDAHPPRTPASAGDPGHGYGSHPERSAAHRDAPPPWRPPTAAGHAAPPGNGGHPGFGPGHGSAPGHGGPGLTGHGGPGPAGQAPRPEGTDLWAAAAARPAGGPPDRGAPPPAAPPEPGPRRRRVLPVALAAALVLVLALVGVAVVRPGPVADWLGDEPADRKTAQAAEPAPVAVLAGADPNAPRPTPEGVRAALEPLLGQEVLGSRVNISVADVNTGDPLYTRGGDDPTVPASVTKLVTAVTVLTARGPTYRIPTRAVAGASPGEVVIVGGGDPTLAVDKQGFYPGAARLDDLAAQVRKALGGTKPTKVTVDGSLYSGPVHEPGWDDDIPTGGYGSAITALMTDAARTDVPRAKRDDANGNHAAQRAREPDLAAGRSFARLLGVPADAVKRGKAPAAGDATTGAPGPGAELGKVESMPLNRMVDVMISDSDNVIAEALARQVALARNQPASFEGGAAAMDTVVAELGLPADEIDLADASGLSRDNRISPSLLTDLIVLAGNGSRPELAVMFGGLPVGGWSGTLADRYDTVAKAGAGVVRAKTGTLTGVHALAGVVTTADGRLLSFAVLTDRVPAVDTDIPRRALDRVVAALAACGCR